MTRRGTGSIGRALRARSAEFWRRVRRRRPGSDPAEFERLRLEILNSPYFNADFYLDHNPDVRASGVDPATHYLVHGGPEGRDPGPRFDSHYYLETYPDVRTSGANPLVHYLRFGRAEGRLIRPLPRPAPRPQAPDDAAWVDLAARLASSRSRDGEPAVDIVVPVFAGLAETANCLRSVVESRLEAETATELVVVDDRGPEPALSSLLDRLSDLGLITLLCNDRNQGFVTSVNRGMDLHADRDVILLNSDTEVYGDWVERLRRAAYSDPWVGTVTPFSNNATICSYPYLAQEYRGAFEVPFSEIDRLASEANAGRTTVIPTAVGFCMYIRRDCLAEAGDFDARAFGHGYGEENDFCQRIAARGWSNLLAADVFVRHLGSTSFGATTQERIRAALEVVKQRFPRYLADVDDFLERDPPRELRRRLDVARLRHRNGERSILFCLHGLDGGTLTHVRELSRLLAREGVGTLLMRPNPNDGRFAEIGRFDVDHLSVACRVDLRHGLSAATDLLRDAGVVHIHVHHLLGYSPDLAGFLVDLADELGVAYDVTAHDYLALCPQLNMIDASGVYCDNHDLDVCESCVARLGSRVGDVSARQWRREQERFLAGARRRFVPHEDAERRFERYFPTLDFVTRHHPESVPERFERPIERPAGEPLRVAVIGAIGPTKGSLQLLGCAEDAARRKLPLEFVVVGFVDRYELNTLGNVRVTGKYDEGDLPRILARERCHLALFLSVWPETYCYTLSQALYAGLFPVALDIGATAERIRSGGWGLVLPWELVHDAARINDVLLATRPTPQPPDWRPIQGEALYPSVVENYYGLSGLHAGATPAASARQA